MRRYFLIFLLGIALFTIELSAQYAPTQKPPLHGKHWMSFGLIFIKHKPRGC